jgi:hAT family C-terminal dimerisation region
LARLAINILSIPGISDFVEKVFSSAKQTLTDRRCSLGSDILEAIECLKSWLIIEDFNRKIDKALVLH